LKHLSSAQRASRSTTIIATSLTKALGPQLVLDEVSVRIRERNRLGIVGPNGVGKSTLLRILAGEEEPDSGSVTRSPPSMTVGYMPQEIDAGPAERLVDYLGRRTGVAAAEAEISRLARVLERDATVVHAYAESLELFSALGGDDLETRAAATCARLGLRARLTSPVGHLSGGERGRAALAAILLARFDVLLLDEPTNDLDFEGLDLLEAFVAASPQGIAMVSHDRDWLERCVTEVLELDEGTHRARLYRGSWDDYVAARRAHRRAEMEAHERYVDERRRLEQRAIAHRRWAEGGVRRAKRKPDDSDRMLRSGRIAGAQGAAHKARAIASRIERLEPVAKPWEGWRLDLSLAARHRAGDVTLRLEKAVIERGDFRMGPIDFEVAWTERVAIVGRNGSGKTTLLQALLGRLPLARGRRYLGRATVLGAIEQHRETFAGARRTLDVFVLATGVRPEEGRTLLAKFGLSSAHVLRPSISLSPGERTRAVLAVLVATGANCLLLDEPTNHLDLPAIEQLESALATFDGSLVVVSHDRRFLTSLAPVRTLRLG
jgi:ATPase subunit of ABC transporter with duplicated ATPase domains